MTSKKSDKLRVEHWANDVYKRRCNRIRLANGKYFEHHIDNNSTPIMSGKLSRLNIIMPTVSVVIAKPNLGEGRNPNLNGNEPKLDIKRI